MAGQRLPVTGNGGLPVLEDGTLLRIGGFARTADGGWDALPALPAAYEELTWHPLNADFSGALYLRSAGLPATVKAAQPLSLGLTWQRGDEAPATLSRFVHLLDGEDHKVAQVDGPVTDAFGPLPLAGWPQDSEIVDLLKLSVPADLPPGEYRLVTGWYDWQTGERLPANGKGAREDGAALLGSIQVVE